LKNSKNNIIFITGTDTDVGKTVVTATITQYYLNCRKNIGVVKAIQTGTTSDLEFIINNTPLKKNDTFCPLYLNYPLAPQQAAEIEEKPHIQTKKLLAEIKKFSENFEITLVEGSGGLYVPIKPSYMMIDLIEELKCPTIIVSRIGLGTINHTLLTVKALQQKNIAIEGIIYNSSQESENDLSTKLNPNIIAETTKIKTLGVLPFQNKLDISELSNYICLNKKCKK
jgi:dethiobiotin synthetase